METSWYISMSTSLTILFCPWELGFPKKNYYHTNSPFRRQQEDYWIKGLGTAFPYGCNHNVANVGNLTDLQTNNVNVMGLFPHRERHRHNHGHHTYTRPTIYDVTLDWLLPCVNPHHIRIKLYSTPSTALKTLFEQTRGSPYLPFSTGRI
jgi:hypothetical protein